MLAACMTEMDPFAQHCLMWGGGRGGDGEQEGAGEDEAHRAYVLRMTKLGVHARQHFAAGSCSEHIALRNLMVQWLFGFMHWCAAAVEFPVTMGAGAALATGDPFSAAANQYTRTARRGKAAHAFSWDFAARHHYTVSAKRLPPVINRVHELCEKLLSFVDASDGGSASSPSARTDSPSAASSLHSKISLLKR